MKGELRANSLAPKDAEERECGIEKVEKKKQALSFRMEATGNYAKMMTNIR